MPFDLGFGYRNIILSWMLHAAFYGGNNLPDGADILERVGGEENDVRQLAGFQCAHVGLLIHAHGADDRGGTEGVHRSHADFVDENFDFALPGGIGIFGGREAVGAGENQDALLVDVRVNDRISCIVSRL